MSATETAMRVLHWAIQPNGPIPRGELQDAEDLLHPHEALSRSSRELSAIAGAKLRWGTPPLGDESPMNLGVVLLAASLGAANVEQARLSRFLLEAVPGRDAASGWLARHGLLVRGLREIPSAMADECRALSPLTGVLDWPAPGRESASRRLITRILGDREGRTSLIQHFATPTTDERRREWQTDVLSILCNGDENEQEFVLSVYEAAMIHHRKASMSLVRSAWSVLTSRGSQEHEIQSAMGLAKWWGPLWALRRKDLDSLRRRRYLHYDYLEGLKLHSLCRRLAGGAM